MTPGTAGEGPEPRVRGDDKAAGGVRWTLFSYALTRLVSWPTTLLLARILDPADFGVVALALLVMQLVGLLSDLGLESTLVLRQDLDRRAQRTVLSVMLLAGAALAVVVAALSPVAGYLLKQPRLTLVVAVLAPTLAVAGLNWFYEGLLLRELEFRKRFYSLLAQAVVTAGTSIVLAVEGAGVWSLVAGQLAGAVVYAAALLSIAPYRLRPGFDRVVARDVVTTGAGFVAQGGLAFLRQNVDYLTVGRMLGARPLGLYSMAYRLSESPSWAVADSVAMVTFPSFSRMRSRGEDIRVAFLSTLRAVALLTVPMGMALSAAADPFTRALLGRHWLPMIGPLAVLGLWAAVRPSQVTAGWFVNSVGHARSTAKVSAFTLALLIPAVIVGATLGAIEGVAVAMLGDVLLNLLLLGRIVSRAGGVRPAQQWSAVMPVVLVAPLAWVAGRAGVLATAGAPPAASLAASVAACLAAYLGLLALCAPAVLREGAAQVGRWLRRATSEEPALT